jgi:hypothetical protein
LAGVSELLGQAMLIAAVIMLQTFVDFLELRNYKLQASCNVFLRICGDNVFKHHKSPFIDVKGSRCRRLKVCELNAVYSKAEEEEEGNLEYMLAVSLI